MAKTVLSLMVFCLAALAAQAAHTTARLVLAADSARPGDTVLAGVVLRMDKEWHTYWRNSGAAGMPTTVEWELPAGVSAGPLCWPVPEKLPDEDLTTYIYHDEVVLLASLKLATNLNAGPLTLKAKVSWLECSTGCLPGDAEVQAALKVGMEYSPSKDEAFLGSWREKLPVRPPSKLLPRARWEKPAAGNVRPLLIQWPGENAVSDADFYPDASEKFEVQPATERIPTEAGKVLLRKPVKKLAGDWPKTISGLLVLKAGSARLAFEADMPVEGPTTGAGSPATGLAPAAPQPAAPAAAPAPPVASFWKMLVWAFLGGLILNVMPCVLPVIALKVLGFVGQAGGETGRVRALGVLYTLGVLVSFLALAGIGIGLKAAGRQASWGIQFSNPQFLVGLTVLITLVALNLFGLFEVSPGGRVLDAASALSSKHGPVGAFFNGVLATVLATPCTAPFLGAALGFAFAQPPALLVVMFLTVGAGLAAPYLVLSCHPAWLKFLPKHGSWMERFKVLMGFPMLATAVWLLSLLPAYYGARSWWLGIFLVVVALAAWIFGQFVQRGTRRRGLALASILVLLAGGYRYIIEGELRWRAPAEETPGTAEKLKEGPDGIDWQRWTPGAVAQALAEGHPVLVDFTARWCATCQFNKRLALEVPSVRAKLKEIHAVSLLGDYTRFPTNITAELYRYGRAGVPLVLVYPKNPKQAPIVLPEGLSPGIVLAALERAGR